VESWQLYTVLLCGPVLLLGPGRNLLRKVCVTGPMACLAVGLIAGPGVFRGVGAHAPGPTAPVLEEAARLTLALSLMQAAFRLPGGYLTRAWRPLTAVLAVGMPLMWLSSALLIGLALGCGVTAALLLSGISPRWALAAVVLTAAVLLGVGLWLSMATLSSQFDEIADNVVNGSDQVRNYLAGSRWGRTVLELVAPSGGGVIRPGPDARAAAVIAAESVAGFVGAVVVVLFIGVYLAVDPGLYVDGFRRLVPAPARPKAAEALSAAGTALRRFLLGQALLMAIVGLLTWVGLWWLGVPAAGALALIAALLEFVPFLGPVLSFAVITAMVMGTDPGLAPAVALLYIGIQSVEGYLLVPLIQERAASLPPALTIAAQVLAGRAAGLHGFVPATPLLAVTMALVDVLYLRASPPSLRDAEDAPLAGSGRGPTG
jgi:predicted PurR-regulated permease PerM